MSSSIAPESEPLDANRPTADIIPFPVRAQAAEIRPEDRLTRALASLNAAMEEQRVAVAAWREALGALKTTTTGLSDSLQRYRSNLDTLSGSVSSLHDKARSLEQWADAATGD